MNDSSHPNEAEIVRRLTESRALQDAPEDLIAKAITLWDRQPRKPAGPRVLAAILSFDSLVPDLALPSTRAPEETRHLLYGVEGRDVDLRIRRSGVGAAGGWSIIGQILGPVEDGGTTVRCGTFEVSVNWSEHGEFHVEPVPAGECTVSLHTGEWEAVLPMFTLQQAT